MVFIKKRIFIINITLILVLAFSNMILVSSLKVDFDSSWEKISDNGFDEKYNIAPRGIEIFQDHLVIGTANWKINNMSDLFNIDSLFRYIFSHNILNFNWISKGCEIWAFKNGEWYEIVGENGFIDGGFGNNNTTQIGFLIKYKDYLYAGVYNSIAGCQIWRTNDLYNWNKVVSNGFGNKNNIWAMSAAIFNKELYVGTYNFKDGCELYKTSNGEKWIPVVGGNSSTKSGFHTNKNFYAWSICEYNGNLYVGTNSFYGCELWKTKDGKNWNPIIAYNGFINANLKGAKYPCGLGKKIGSIRNMFVYNNELYMCMIGGNVYANLTFNDSNLAIHTPLQPNLFLRKIQNDRAASIFKYNSSTEQVIGVIDNPITNKNNAEQFGFGNPQNIYFWSTELFNEDIYIGTLNLDTIEFIINTKDSKIEMVAHTPTGGAEIWHSDNGRHYQKISWNGFQNDYNIGIRALKIYNGELYAVTCNLKSGCEVWKYHP